MSTKIVSLKKADASSRLGVSFVSDGNSVSVAAVVPESTSEKAGLKKGDKVLSILGQDVSGMSSQDTAKLLRSATGVVDIEIEVDEPEEVEDVESAPLVEPKAEVDIDSEADNEIAAGMSGTIGFTILIVQILAAGALYTNFEYGSVDDFTQAKYTIFRDIMVMLLLGFGYLMTFLEKYGLGAVGFTMLLTALNMECNLLIENYLVGSTTISMDSIINAEFSAATLLISFGALIGRATPLQMCVLSIAESLFYALNKVFIVFGVFNAEDVGGTLTIHMFGAFFGLAASYALGPQEKASASNNAASRVSDVFSLVGTTLLWVYWPSFVGATETGVAANEMHCLTNTIMSLIGSTGAAFFYSQYLNNGKFDAVHIQNSTLAGGVAIGATARLAMGPGVAFIVGLAAGVLSVIGYFYSSPYLEEKFGLYDTCGVANLHGIPSVLGGVASVLLVLVDYKADFLAYGLGSQSVIQLMAVLATIAAAVVSGFITGKVTLGTPVSIGDSEIFASVPDYEDAVWWIME